MISRAGYIQHQFQQQHLDQQRCLGSQSLYGNMTNWTTATSEASCFNDQAAYHQNFVTSSSHPMTSHAMTTTSHNRQYFKQEEDFQNFGFDHQTTYTSVNSWPPMQAASQSSLASPSTTLTSQETEDFDGSENWEDLLFSLSPGSSTDSYPSVGSPEKSDASEDPASADLRRKPSTTMTTKWQRKKAFEMTLPAQERRKRRLAANARERKRMTNLNDAFERLREILPSRDSMPISKMEALQMAQAYITELSSILEK